MHDDISLAQLEVFIACARMGSFSAVARDIGRTQSMISGNIAKLEARLGVKLFDRASRQPVLTEQGRAVLAHAQAIMHRVDELKSRARTFAAGTEAELSIAADAILPVQSLTRAVGSFRENFPGVQLRVHVETPSAAAELVLTRRCRLGVVGSLVDQNEALVVDPILNVTAVAIVARTHALASHPGRVPRTLIDKQVQLVVSDGAALAEGMPLGALSPQTWQVTDLQVKREFLCAGFGWGCMPLHIVEEDIAVGRLVQIDVEGLLPEMLGIPLSSVYRRDLPLGPAANWLLNQLAGRVGPAQLTRGLKADHRT
jgi:DNA-binding transcriptional LysR family regulator